MDRISYALYDIPSEELYHFVAPAESLAKDVILTTLETNVFIDYETNPELLDFKEKLQTAISATTSPQELIVALAGFDFLLSIVPVTI